MKRFAALILLAVALVSPAAQAASFAMNPTLDAFVTTGPTGNLSGNNYGGAGSGSRWQRWDCPTESSRASCSSTSGPAAASFDSAFGAGQWSLQSATLQLTAGPA